jgi:general secretion pathway protein G
MLQRIRRTATSGFTLVELLVVMMIITVLAGTGLALYSNSIKRSKEAALKQDLFLLREAIDQYYADKNRYPASLETLVEEKYIRAVPEDPFTNSADTWQVEMSEPEPGNPAAELGVFDVKSGAEGTAMDGSVYAEW